MPGIIVVGVQWGDEGKGKMIDILSEKADLVIRGQGGNNAGHTIAFGNKEFKLHLIPSGIIHPQVECVIGGGCVIDPAVLLKEIATLHAEKIQTEGRLWISPYAHVIFPFHLMLDIAEEKQKGKAAIGTTGSGIGPCYTDAVSRHGIRMGELIRPDLLKTHLAAQLARVNVKLEKLFGRPPLELEALFKDASAFGKKLAPYVTDTETKIHTALGSNKTVLFEGAQGTYLDITFGTYPFVTSSHTIASGVLSGSGVGPTQVDHTLGVVKAYTTRVGAGPLPTALNDADARLFPDQEIIREVGTTTGRRRSLGWFDAVLTRRAVQMNGLNSFALTKLDVLDSLDTIKICTGYRLNDAILKTPPSIVEDLLRVEPIYEEVRGWKTNTQNAKKVSDLPQELLDYVKRLEELCHCPCSFISVGPKRDQTITLNHPLSTR